MTKSFKSLIDSLEVNTEKNNPSKIKTFDIRAPVNPVPTTDDIYTPVTQEIKD